MKGRFQDFTIEEWLYTWEVYAWDSQQEETKNLEITFPQLAHFTKNKYVWSVNEAKDYLNKSESWIIEDLLKEYFTSKF